MSTSLSLNTENLRSILNTVNTLPEAGTTGGGGEGFYATLKPPVDLIVISPQIASMNIISRFIEVPVGLANYLGDVEVEVNEV